MYRVVKKTTKKTEHACLECKFCKIIKKMNKDVFVECLAENKCISGEFNSKYFYCVEYKGFNELSDYDIEKMQEKKRFEDSKREFRKYLNKYYTKKEATKMYKQKYG